MRKFCATARGTTRAHLARAALEAGATYVVVGRPIRTADDPIDAAKRIVGDIERATL